VVREKGGREFAHTLAYATHQKPQPTPREHTLPKTPRYLRAWRSPPVLATSQAAILLRSARSIADRQLSRHTGLVRNPRDLAAK